MLTSSLHLCSTPALYSYTTCTAVSRLVVCSSQAANVSAHHSNVPSGSGDWSSGGGTLFHATRALRALMPVAVAHSETFGSFRHSNRAAAGTWWRSSTETASRVKCGKPGKVKDPFQSVFLPMHGCTEAEMTRRSPTPPPDFPLDSLPIYEPHDQNGPPRTKISFHLPMRSLPASLALDFFFPGANPTDHSQAANAHSSSRAHDSGEAASSDFGASYEEADNGAGREHQHTSRSDRAAHGKERSCVAGADRVAGDTSTAFCRLCRENFDNDGTLRSHITVADRARHVSHPVREVALETLTLLAVRGYPIDHIMTVWADVLYSCPLFPRIRSMTNPRWSIEERASQIGIILRALKRVGVLDVALATAEPTDTVSCVNSHYRRRRVAFERLEYIGDNCWGNNISNRIMLLYPDQQWLYSERCSTFTLVRDACEMNVNLDFVFDTLELWQLLSATAHARLQNGKVKADLVEGIFGELHLYLYGMAPKLQDDVEYVETNGAREVQLVALVEHCLTELYDLIVLKHARDLVTSAIPLANELAAKRIWARTRPFLLQQKRPNTGRARAKASVGNGAPHASAFPSTGHTASFPSPRVGAATANASSAALEDLFDVSPSSLQQQHHTSVCGVRSGAIELSADGRTESAAVSGSGKGRRQKAEKRAGKVAAEASKRDGRLPVSPLLSTPASLTLSASIQLGGTRVLPALPGLFTTPHVCSERVPNPLRLLPLSAIPSMTYCHHTRSDVFATMKKSYERLGLLQDESRRMRCMVSPTPPAWAVLIGTLLPQLVGFAPAGDTKAASAEARRLLASMDEGGLYCRDAFYNLAASPSAPTAAGRPHASLSPIDTAWMLQNTGLPPLSATPSKSREDYNDVSSGESPCRRCTFAPSRYVPPGTRTPPAGVVTDRNLCRGTFAFLAVGVENAVAEAEKLTRTGTMLAGAATQADPTTGVRSLGEGPTQHSTEKKSPEVLVTMYAERVKAAVDYWQRRPQKSLQRFSAPSGEASLPH
ncbi:RNA editing complex protein MP90, putative [Leishmania tarentolae]|uniref:RNA editing complex protein MP90, putative n=1 Tax=Leishmania tarentolae TaxID=5689 RepID=A0A640KL32_LEITA|nr:RNA editing complex protein MP90, putative [Leishmania tarentolae]